MTDLTIPVIHDDASYEAALDEIRTISLSNPQADSAEMQRLDAIAILAQAYDAKISPFTTPLHPVEAVRYAAEFRGISNARLAEILGGANRLSEVLALKRPLTLGMIRRLNAALGLSMDVLCAEYRLVSNGSRTQGSSKAALSSSKRSHKRSQAA